MTYKIIYLDTCYPDYFAGFGGETLAVAVDSESTMESVKADLLREISGAELWDSESRSPMPGSAYDELEKSAADLFSAENPAALWDKGLGDGDGAGFIYAYFGIKKERESE